MLCSELANTKEQLFSRTDRTLKVHIKNTIKYLMKNVNYYYTGNILDVGQRSPLTDAMRKVFKYSAIDNTTGDLDLDFKIPKDEYDLVVFCHTMEHIFNPLYCMLRLKEVMKSDSSMFVMLPRRGKLLWYNRHFHEIDHYRFSLLMKRAGFKIINWEYCKPWRSWYQYFTGLRPFYRLFREFHITYQVVKKSNYVAQSNKN